jgi:hypothetical protein
MKTQQQINAEAEKVVKDLKKAESVIVRVLKQTRSVLRKLSGITKKKPKA